MVEHIVAELRDVQQRLALLERRTLTRRDGAALARIVPALAGTMGSAIFTAHEAVAHDAAALRLVLHGRSARSLGRLLRRGEGRAISGLVVSCAGEERHAALWKVAKVVGAAED